MRRATYEDKSVLEELWAVWIESKRGSRGFEELYQRGLETVDWDALLDVSTVLVVESDGRLTALGALTRNAGSREVVELQPFAYSEQDGALLLLEGAAGVAQAEGAVRIEYSALAGDRLFKSAGEESGFKGAYVLLSRRL